MAARHIFRSCVFFLVVIFARCEAAVPYYGRYIGPLSRLLHSVSGDVYAVDARTLHIRDFTYDGEGPAAYFYAGNSKAVGPGGFFVRDETGSNGVLKKYNKKHITITLPEGKNLNNIRWFSVWCEEFAVNFGDIQIPRGLDFPKPQKISPLAGVHAVSSENIVIVDAQTLLIPSFSYDGEAPDAKFWVGRGQKPSPQGIRVPDENGKQTPLRRYDRKTIVLTLPGDLTIFDIGHFGVWCEAFTVDFGHVQIPASLNVPPSLKMLGVSPQSKLNCEVLSDDLAYEVRWAIAGDSIVIQLVAKLEDGEYMSFGLSGEEDRSAMIGGDVVVAWVDQSTLNGYAHDYYLDAKSQCAGTHGSCPDYSIESNAESVRLLNAALVNGYSIVTYQRPLRAHDGLDMHIVTNRSQPIIWAVGPLNSKMEVSYHSITSKGNVFIDFGRPPKWNCPIPQSDSTSDSSSSSEEVANHEPVNQSPKQRTEASVPAYKAPPPPAPAPTNGAWDIPAIQCNEPDDGVFYAQMGPTGGKRGYPAITGHVGWGIAYYINGLLIPEIHVVRGHTYSFVVEGGLNPEVPAKFHPFYITDDPVGGYQYKTPEERRKVNIYAGAELDKNGEVVPTGIGRLCNWTPDPEQPTADEFASFGAYQRTLTLVCDHGDPAVVRWTPDDQTPDTVYYQCFTHRHLGWKIHVHDDCVRGSASEPIPSILHPEEELQAKPSIQVTTRVKPDFPPQSLTSNNKIKYPNKSQFPYEFQKPPMDMKNGNNQSHIIPVTEEVEDIPETTTTKQMRLNVTYDHHDHHPPNVALVNTGHKHPPNHQGKVPMRVPYGNLRPPPNHRPMMIMRRPVTGPQVIVKPPPQHAPHMNYPMIHHQPRPVIVKKPIHRVQPRPPMMSIRPGPSPIVGPSPGTAVGPAPSPGNHHKQVYIHKFKKPIGGGMPMSEKNKAKLHPSQMIGQSAEELSTKLPIAVNTGFNPGSLVIESGFTPIINNPQVAEERVSEIEYDDDDYNNNEGVINVDGSDEQKSQTEMFEPMFIPSPLDSNAKHNKKATTEPVKKIRKPIRQVIVRKPVYDDASFRSEPDDEEAMADEKMETYYNPGSQPILTYDGKQVAGSVAPPVPPPPKTSPKGSEQLKHSPQFGPFKGEIPPPIPKKVPGNFPQLKETSRPVALPQTSELLFDKTKKEEVEVVTAQAIQEDLDTDSLKRTKRSSHHQPEHSEADPTQDHSQDDHSMHDHMQHDPTTHKQDQPDNQKTSAGSVLSAALTLTMSCVYLVL
ncbi:unnamed protein product [Nezara viridula]|uniref:Protein Skeletor n=1 Tax=Nezara viridula TaxID=85310 RepID=A0A9P0HMX6_NEZVI|nr:unnamed protein product [Nezara viridula]